MRNLMSRSLLVLAVIGASLAVPAVAPQAAAAGPTTYLVTNTSGDPAVSGSLPWALTQANYATKGFDYIRFDIPTWPYPEIVLSQPLWVNDTVNITGPLDYYGGYPLISVRGQNLPYLFILQSDPQRGVTSSSSTIAGLGMVGFTDAAIVTTPEAQGTFIQSNWIGTAKTSTGAGAINNVDIVPPGTLADGVELNSSFNTVRNNQFSRIDFGVIIGGRRYPGNIVKTNSIQRNWMSQMTGDGVFLWDGAQENFIGPLNNISSIGGVAVELVHSSNKLNVIFDNDIIVELAGVAIGGGATGNAVGGPFGGNRIESETGLVLGFGTGKAAYNTWVEGNTFKDGSTSYDTSFGALIQGGSTGNFLGTNSFQGQTVGVYLGDASAKGTTRNAVNGNTFGAPLDQCAWSPNQYAMYFSYANYNFALNNGAINTYYYQYKSKGNSIVIRQLCVNYAKPSAPPVDAAPSAPPAPTQEFGVRRPT